MPYGTFRDLIRRLFKRTLSEEEKTKEIEDRLEEVFDDAEKEGLIDDETGEMVQGILDLTKKEVSEIMVPRTRITAVEETVPVAEIVRTILTSGHSRVPVFSGTVDRIVGVLYAKDLLKFWGRSGGAFDLKDLLREPFFIPESQPLDDLLKDFKERKIQIAVVVDEYGGTSGLVTLEDVLEVIVGDIRDEYDKIPPEKLTAGPDGWVRISAQYAIADLFDHFEIETPKGDFSTVGGWIFDRIGRIPKKDEVLELDLYPVKIEDADNRRINRVSIMIQGSKERRAQGKGS